MVTDEKLRENRIEKIVEGRNFCRGISDVVLPIVFLTFIVGWLGYESINDKKIWDNYYQRLEIIDKEDSKSKFGALYRSFQF